MSAKRSQQHTRQRIFRIVVLSIAIAMVVVAIAVSVWVRVVLGRIRFSGDEPMDPNTDFDIQIDEEYTGVEVDPSDYDKIASVADIPLRGDGNGIHNILLVGIDSRKDNFIGLSDTNIILSINDKTKTVKMISLLRDVWVTIPGRDKDGDGKDDIGKLNTAYAYGRHKLQRQMIAQNFRLDVDDYIGVNFVVLPDLIDAMGGLDIELTAKEMTQIPEKGCRISVRNPGFIPMSGEPGVHHLDGFQAMEYARIRKIDSDFQRTDRQREVVSLLLEKAKRMNYVQLLNVVYLAADGTDTNMTTDELVEFAANAMKYRSYTIETGYHIPEQGEFQYTTIEGKGSGILLTDPKKIVQHLHEYIYG